MNQTPPARVVFTFWHSVVGYLSLGDTSIQTHSLSLSRSTFGLRETHVTTILFTCEDQ